jgi:glycosyltransferase involved in cell wall biosynthesis
VVREEVSVAIGCDQIVCVSEREKQEFSRCGFNNVHVLGHALECSPTPNDFSSRRDILFVGALDNPDSPNSDSLRWFCKDIFPSVQFQLNEGIRLRVAGRICDSLREELRGELVELLGEVTDLTDLYNHARLFIAPTRFAGGIPYKVHEAAARGIPVVTTKVIEAQLGWTHETEVLVADDCSGFAAACSRLYQDCALWTRLRENALRRVAIDCSPEDFARRLREIIG